MIKRHWRVYFGMPDEILLGGIGKGMGLLRIDENGKNHYQFDLYFTNLRIMETQDSYFEGVKNVWNVTKNITRETQNLSIDERFKILEKLEKKRNYQITKGEIADLEIVKKRAGLLKILSAILLIKLKTGKEVKYSCPYYHLEVFIDLVTRFFPEVKVSGDN